MSGFRQDNSKTNLIAGGISALTICLAVLFLSSLLFAANRGLDYSDESYAYLWACYPFEYRFGVRLSGFFLHPIELLVQHSIAGLRIVGMFLTAASGVLVGFVFANTANKVSGLLEKAELIAACGITMFLSNIYWTNTPSYQHMTVWGLALVLAGFAILIRRAPASPAQHLGIAACISIGGLILAFAKIPSAMG